MFATVCGLHVTVPFDVGTVLLLVLIYILNGATQHGLMLDVFNTLRYGQHICKDKLPTGASRGRFSCGGVIAQYTNLGVPYLVRCVSIVTFIAFLFMKDLDLSQGDRNTFLCIEKVI